KEVVTVLLDRGATIDATTKLGSTALHLAAKNGHMTVVKSLLDRGACNDAPNDNGETALDLARKLSSESLTELLTPKITSIAEPVQ
ncbi:ankyrin repeat-containing domain protein, partial [Tirmania nivea]